MRLVPPIRLDSEVFLATDVGDFRGPLRVLRPPDLATNAEFQNSTGKPVVVNGRDTSKSNKGLGVILTNLVGIRDGGLLKACPKCKSVKPLQEFGDAGRRMEDGEHRDQSNCNKCRQQ